MIMAQKKFNAVSTTSFFDKLGLGESYTSLMLGIVVVVAGVLLTISFLRSARLKDLSVPKQEVSSVKTEKLPQKNIATSLPVNKSNTEYTVVPGDNLWKIAEKHYKSGYNWVDIAKANNLSDPSVVFAGNKLIIPKVDKVILAQTQTVDTQEPASVSRVEKITGDTYKIVKGDDLWDIAVRAYGDGFKWVDIANANNLTDPNLIHSDNILKIPR